jgi:hypothetical protein
MKDWDINDWDFAIGDVAVGTKDSIFYTKLLSSFLLLLNNTKRQINPLMRGHV